MTEITPTYYAAGRHTLEFVLKGTGFDHIPANAKFVVSGNNDNPLENRDATDNIVAGVINYKSEDRMELSTNNEYTYSGAYYIGAILSQDGERIYWENDTKPLP